MKESYRKGIANHPDPESCARLPSRGGPRSVDRGTCGPGMELRNQQIGRADGVVKPEGNTLWGAIRESHEASAQSETPCTHGNSVRENQEGQRVSGEHTGPVGERLSHKTDMNARRQSDGCVVPAKGPNKGGSSASAEGPEGRQPTKENTSQKPTHRTQCREGRGSSSLSGVRQFAAKYPR
jgi:hypothetical protein